jgi:hypothetical protein
VCRISVKFNKTCTILLLRMELQLRYAECRVEPSWRGPHSHQVVLSEDNACLHIGIAADDTWF